MKTSHVYKAAALLTLLFVLLTSNADAQASPFPVQNNTPCNMTINWRVVRPNCNNLCGSALGVAIAPGANSFNWSCMGLAPCDIKIEVTHVGATMLGSPVGVSLFVTSNSIPATPCGGPYTITMSAAGAAIN